MKGNLGTFLQWDRAFYKCSHVTFDFFKTFFTTCLYYVFLTDVHVSFLLVYSLHVFCYSKYNLFIVLVCLYSIQFLHVFFRIPRVNLKSTCNLTVYKTTCFNTRTSKCVFTLSFQHHVLINVKPRVCLYFWIIRQFLPPLVLCSRPTWFNHVFSSISLSLLFFFFKLFSTCILLTLHVCV